mgnify:CR=1 FL=1
MSNKKKYEGEKEMAESRKMKTEKGLALVLVQIRWQMAVILQLRYRKTAEHL